MNNKNIPVIILCGGKGMRMREETEFKPKPMVEIGGRPILWHIMKIYAHYGYHNFILALGYKGDYMKEYFLKQKYYESDFSLDTKNGEVSNVIPNGDVPQDEFNIIFSDTGLETPHGERVLKLKKYIPGDLFMVTYGDGVANIDIKKLVNFHKKMGTIGTITGVHPVSKWGLVNIGENDIVTKLDQKPLLYDYVNGGFMVFKKEFLDILRKGDMIEDALTRLVSRRQLALYRHEDFWYGMDTYREMKVLNKLWEESKPWAVWERNKKIINEKSN